MLKTSQKRAGIASLVAAGILAGSMIPANAYAEAAVPQTTTTASTTGNIPGYHGYFVYPGQEAAGAVSTTDSPAPLSGVDITQLKSDISVENLSPERAAIINEALAGEGGTYVWGGKTFKNWDCSGFVAYVYKQHGINLTAYTHAMKNEVRKVDTPQPGDIVFTNNYEHVGIYLGQGKMISALNPEQGTIVTDVDGGGMMPVDGFYSAF